MSPLPQNCSCPKWNKNQPERYELSAIGGGEVSSNEAEPNCYLCCDARTGFGCTSTTPKDTRGSLPDVVPFDKNGYGSFPGSITWTSTSFTVASELLAHTANAPFFVGRIYDFLDANLDFFTRTANATTGLIEFEAYGDWNALAETSKLFIANAHYVHNALILSSIASAVGEPAAAQTLIALAAVINAALSSEYWNSTCSCWDTGSQTAQAIALAFGLGDKSTDSTAAAAQLAADVVARGLHPSGGCPGTRWLLQMLSATGRSDLSLALARQTEPPSWGAMLVGIPSHPPLGTLWEGWNGYGGGSSGAHIMLGGGYGEWLYSGALGIRFGFRQEARVVEEEAAGCLASLGLRLDLTRTHAVLSHGGACAIARVVASTLAARARGEPASKLFARAVLQEAVRREAPPRPSTPAALAPLATLVLDAHVVRTLRSAEGQIETPAGTLAVRWALKTTQQEDDVFELAVTVPHATQAELYFDAALCPKGRLRLSQGGADVMPAPIEWVPRAQAFGMRSESGDNQRLLRLLLPNAGDWIVIM